MVSKGPIINERVMTFRKDINTRTVLKRAGPGTYIQLSKSQNQRVVSAVEKMTPIEIASN